MKTHIQKHNLSILLLISAILLFSMAIPGSAAASTAAPDCALIISCRYSDIDEDDAADRWIYEENVFLLSSKASGLSIVAEYNQTANAYVVTDLTADKDTATQFRCSPDGKLLIKGLPRDTYILEHIDTLTGYMTLSATEIIFSDAGIIVDGRAQNTNVDNSTALVSITLVKGFDLPMQECGPFCRLYNKFGAGIFLATGCVLIAGCLVGILAAIYFGRKKHSESGR